MVHCVLVLMHINVRSRATIKSFMPVHHCSIFRFIFLSWLSRKFSTLSDLDIKPELLLFIMPLSALHGSQPPGKSCIYSKLSRTQKVLENDFGPRNSWNLQFVVKINHHFLV